VVVVVVINVAVESGMALADVSGFVGQARRLSYDFYGRRDA